MKISVTIPAYKKTYLQECIESILVQTYTDFEVIIVNDASPEDLESVVTQFSDSRIRYYHNEKNCGAVDVVDNWNICLRYAKSDYVICMGDDDRLLPTCLEEYAKLIEAYPGRGVYHAWTQIIDEHSQVVRMQEARPVTESVYSMMWERWNGRYQYIGDFLYDRELLVQNGGFYKLPLAWASDDISAYMAAASTGIVNMQVPGFQYRVNSQTISKTGNIDIKLDAINQEEQWYKDFLKTEPDCSDVVVHTFWRMVIGYLSKAMMKKRIFTISTDMANNGLSRIFHYIHHRKDYSLTTKMLGYALIDAIKQRYV